MKTINIKPHTNELIIQWVVVTMATISEQDTEACNELSCKIASLNMHFSLFLLHSSPPLSHIQVLSPNAIAVRTPPATMTGEVDVTLIFRASGAQFCISNPGKFLYTGKSNHRISISLLHVLFLSFLSLAPDDQIFENSFCRIERVIRQQDDPDQLPKVHTHTQ